MANIPEQLRAEVLANEHVQAAVEAIKTHEAKVRNCARYITETKAKVEAKKHDLQSLRLQIRARIDNYKPTDDLVAKIHPLETEIRTLEETIPKPIPPAEALALAEKLANTLTTAIQESQILQKSRETFVNRARDLHKTVETFRESCVQLFCDLGAPGRFRREYILFRVPESEITLKQWIKDHFDYFG